MDSLTSTSEIVEKVYLFAFLSSYVFFEIFIFVQHFFDAVKNQFSNKKYILELIKRRSKAQEKNILREHFLKFGVIKNILKPMGVWFRLVYKINKNNCCLFAEVIQTQKHPTSLGNISFPT